MDARALLIALVALVAADARAQDQRIAKTASAACPAMTNLRLPDVRIAEAVAVDPTARPASPARVPHCRVSGVIGKEIRFSVLLPDSWNQRFFMGGAGGYAGTVENMAITSVNAGYATAGTDTGHQGVAFFAGWALDDLERQINFGHAAVHRTAEVAKAIVRAYYTSDAKHSYFFGCSNGGRQGLMEAQRYPLDFDGIIAGAPALDFTRIAASFVRNAQTLYPNPRAITPGVVTTEQLRFLDTRVLESCDAGDGVKDGVMEDPRRCNFTLASIRACPEGQPASDCLTSSQRAMIERLYSPTTNQRGRIYPGQPFGGEGDPGGWSSWIVGSDPQFLTMTGGRAPSAQFAFGTEFFKYFAFADSTWDYSRYDLSSWERDTKQAAGLLNSDDVNLDPFKARGGKLILWHGWSDPALNPLSTIGYYDRLQSRDAQVRDYARLFMMPGVVHCAGGAGPDQVQWFDAIADWVERGKAPESVVATKLGQDRKVVRTRPLCPYPQRAVHTGRGNTDEAASFACRAP